MLNAALNYIKKNISIIPVGKNKRPLIEWKQYQQTMADEKTVRQWFKDFPDMQIAIVTGKISNLIVVDIDDPAMDLSWLPETAVVKTGSGGFHYYYQYTGAFPNKARIRENIDIRADGGYVLAPPSWNEKGQYEIIKRLNTVSFPMHLFTVSPKFSQQVKTEYPGYSKGQRNDEMARYIGHLLAKIHPSEWEALAWPLVQEANQKNTPPLFDRELRATFDSIVGKERSNTTQRWYQTKPEKIEYKIKVKKDYEDRYTWGTRGLDTSLAIIERGNFIIIGAKRSSGKTTFTFDMACKNALLFHKVLYISLEMDEDKIKKDFARKYAGYTIAEEYDNNIPEYKQQANARKLAEIESIENLYFRGMRRGSGTKWEDVVKIINEFEDLDLIFIDNLDLIDGVPGETNNDRQIRITKQIMNFTEEYQIPLILIHHHRKGNNSGKDYGSDELSGSGKIGDNADVVLKVSRCHDPEASYPEKYKTMIYQQKGRGFPDAVKAIYFIRGTFEDNAPLLEQYDDYGSSFDRMDYMN